MTTTTHGRRAATTTAATLAIFAAVLAASPARADLVVSGASGAPGVETGAKVPDAHVFTLPKDASLRLPRTPSGAQYEMHGPFKGTLEAHIADCTGMLSFTRGYCGKKAGGDSLPVGGTRGIKTPAP